MKKIGTVIALNTNKLDGKVYLAEGNALTPNISMAKTFNASKKVLMTIKAQAIAEYPEFNFVASNVERWAY